MPAVPFQTACVETELKAAPITPEWIISGNPQARATELVRSHDGSAYTVVWECTGGSFTWTYNCDETIHIVEGSIILTDGGNAPTRLGPGDIVFFPKGSHVHWEVEGYVKKVAFFRRVVPNPLTGVYKVARKVKAMMRGAPATSTNPMGVADHVTQSA